MVGEQAVRRPDGRWFVTIDDGAGDRVVESDHDLYTTVDELDGAALERCRQLGFVVHRREHLFLIPTDPDTTGLREAAPPDGIALRSADEVDVNRLRALDERLREDVPGSDGWINDPDEFARYTFDPRQFDPATYPVAVREADGELVGLARIWKDPMQPRIGLIGVLAEHRRTGLARALLAAALLPLHERGVAAVTAEADIENAASVALLTGLGGRRTGGVVELIRRHRPS